MGDPHNKPTIVYYAADQVMQEKIKKRLIGLWLAFLFLGEWWASYEGRFDTAGVHRPLMLWERPTRAQLTAIISRYRSADDAARLAGKVLVLSDCFGIDSLVYAGLITRESGWRQGAVSPTGASGLTQFTGPGIREVSAQLGIPSARARPETVGWFRDQLEQCVQPRLKMAWTHLWKRALTLRQQKKLFRGDENLALVYGAVLLKTYVTVERNQHPRSRGTWLMRRALARYNGERQPRLFNGRLVKGREAYQQSVMKLAGLWAGRAG